MDEVIAQMGTRIALERSSRTDIMMAMSVPTHRRRTRAKISAAAMGSVAGLLLTSQPLARGSDFSTIAQRVTAQDLTGLPSVSTVDNLMSTMQSNGSWTNVNYADTSATNWSPETHVDNMLSMAQLYADSGSSLYHNATLGTDISRAFNYWNSSNPSSSNWWYNDIGALQPLGSMMVLMGSNLSTGQINTGANLLARAAAAIPTYGSGQNMVDLSIVGIDQGIVSNSSSTVATAFSNIGSTIAVIPADGIQYDNSFQFHGPQLYIGGYGQLYDNDVLNEASISAGTSYAITTAQQDLIINQLVNGTEWFIRGQALDITASGRGDSRAGISTAGTSYVSAIENALSLGDYDTPELQAFLARQQAAQSSGVASSTQNTLSGNRAFYDSDIMVQQRPAYYESVKISSVRTSQPETGNGEGLTNLYLGDGVNQIMVTGQEYNNIEPIWNWYMLPGTTIEQDGRSLTPSVAWGETGTATYAGGVSDGTYGAEAFNYNRFDVAAKKSWYFFDNEEVALGAAIISSNTSAPVYTTLNQCLLTSTVTYETTASPTPQNMSMGTVTPSGLKWVYQGGVGYFFLAPVSNATIKAATQTGSWYKINTTQSTTAVSGNVFTLYVNHGTAVSNGSYSYIAVPGITEADMDAYEASMPIQVLRNDGNVQAVQQTALDITQASFYAGDAFSIIPGETVAANGASMLMMQRQPNVLKLSASNPQNAQMNLAVTLTNVNLSGSSSWFDAMGSGTANLNLPGGSLAGSTVGFTMSSDGAATPTISLSSNDGASAYTYTVNAAVILPASTTFQTDSLSNLTFASSVSGPATVTKTGSGTVFFSAANSYSGSTNVSGGTLSVGGNQTAVTGNWNVDTTNTNAATLNVSSGSVIVVPSSSSIQIGGSSSNTATEILNAAGSITNNGTLYLGRNSSLNLYSGGAWNQSGAVSGYVPAPLTFAGTASFTFNQIAGSNQAMGTLTFAGGEGTIQSTYGGSGDTRVTFSSLGTRSIGATGNFIVSGGTNGATNEIVLTGLPAGFINQGTFFDGSSYAYMNSSGGSVRAIAYGSDSGAVTSNGGTTLSSAAQQQFTGAITGQKTATFTTLNDSGNNPFTLASSATLTVSGILKSGNLAGGATVSGSTGSVIEAPSDGDLVIRTDGPNDSLKITASIIANGSSSLTKTGAGILTLAGTNTFTGGVFVNEGTLQVSNSANFGNVASTLTLNSATVEVTSTAVSTGREFLLTSPTSTFQIDSGASLTITNTSSGMGTLNKTGPGTLILSGTSTYSGGTILTAGTLTVGSNSTSTGGPLGTGSLNLNGGTLTNSAVVTVSNPIFVSASTSSNVIASSSGNFTLTGTITGSGVLQNNASVSNSVFMQGDISQFTGTINYVDNTGLNNLTFNGTGNALNGSSAEFVLSGATGSSSGGLQLDTNGIFQMGDLSGSGGLITTNNAVAATLQVGALNDSAGIFSGTIANGVGTIALTKVGTGTLLLGNTNSYSGNTNISAGTLAVSTTGSLTATKVITVAAGATFDVSGMITSIPAVTVNGTAIFGPSTSAGIGVFNLSNLSVGTAGQISLAKPSSQSNRIVLATSALILPGTINAWVGELDLGSNDLIVHNGNLATITNQLQEGDNGGSWNGTSGIVSTAANFDPTHLTSLGVILNTTNGTNILHSSFDGISTVATDVLVKYTYVGDANLDGKVDGSDYSLIDNGYLHQLTGWYNGDFNYDGVINGSDYTLIDNAFNSQGTQISSVIAIPTFGIAVVPEPAGMGVLAVATVSMLRRRKNR
jgi:chondroitin AC lyase